jgi:hypothetical protein
MRDDYRSPCQQSRLHECVNLNPVPAFLTSFFHLAEDMHRHWAFFMRQLAEITSAIRNCGSENILKVFPEAFPDWIKLFNFFTTQAALYKVSDPFSAHYMSCAYLWANLGVPLGFLETEPESGCQSPRCPATDVDVIARFACPSCCTRRYCSYWCQKT